MIDDHGPDCACDDCRFRLPAPAEDTVRGLVVLFGIGLLLLAGLLIAEAWAAEPDACPPEPAAHVARLPDDTEIPYADATLDPVGKYLVLHPWPSRRFCDGFES